MATPPFFADVIGAVPSSGEPLFRAHSYVLSLAAIGAYLLKKPTLAKVLAGASVADTVARQLSPWYAGHVACQYRASSWAEMVACHTGKGASAATVEVAPVQTVEAFRASRPIARVA